MSRSPLTNPCLTFRRPFVAAMAAALLLTFALPAAADDEADCNRAIGKSVSLLRKSHQKRISKCLRFANFDCSFDSLAIEQSENRVRARVAGAGSSCDAAVNGQGLPVSSFGPTACPAAWNACDVAVPAIATLADLADCLVCVEVGYDRKVRDDLDFPLQIEDNDERRCVRFLYEALGQAVRIGMHPVNECAKDAERQPFACPVDPSPATPFGRRLTKIERLADKCDDATGMLGDDVKSLCNGTVTTTTDLATCFNGLVRCITCRSANTTYGQTEDCVAAAAPWDCQD
jgi:hypothetical protein